jgi:hypothetical protein
MIVIKSKKTKVMRKINSEENREEWRMKNEGKY